LQEGTASSRVVECMLSLHHLLCSHSKSTLDKLNCGYQIYNKTFVRWTTHKPEGLSIKDVNMASFSDEQGKVHGEVETALTESGDSFGLKGSGLVENVKQI